MSAPPAQSATGTPLPTIKGFLPTSLIEWEGRIACAIFLPGCNFRCPYCHASDLVVRHAELPAVALDEVVRHLDTHEGWLDGVVVSGGEATLQPRLPWLIEQLRRHVPAVKLDTNGSRPAVVEALVSAGLVESVAMDVKAPLDERYSAAAGVMVDLRAIRSSIEFLKTCGIEHEFRTTVVPGLHTIEDIVAIARTLGAGEKLVLQQFAPLDCLEPSYRELRPIGRQHLREMAAAASGHLVACRVRGETAPSGGAR